MTDRRGTPSTAPESAGAAPGRPSTAPADATPVSREPGHADEAHPWSDAGRPRGLDAWFAPGGEDDAPPERVADERRLIRLLAIMLAILVGVPLVLTAIAFAIELTTGRG